MSQEVAENTGVPSTENQPEDVQPKTAQDYMGYDPQIVETLTNAVADDTPEDESKVDPQELINKTLKEVKVDENGKFIYPENIDPMLKAAVAAAKSFRDTQASYTKSQQRLKALEAELAAMRTEIVKEAPRLVLTPEEQQQLNELKYKDPDKWYQTMQQLEQKGAEAIEKKFGEVREKTEAEAIVEERKRLLTEFNKGKEKQLTPEQLELEVPAKWVQEVVEGKTSFVDFLEKAETFIYGSKAVDQPPKPPKTTDLNKETGSSFPQESNGDKEGINYAEVIF